VDEVICWLTGYSPRALATQIKQRKDFETFFREAPSLNPLQPAIGVERTGEWRRADSREWQ
jgi:hypothetical protein